MPSSTATTSRTTVHSSRGAKSQLSSNLTNPQSRSRRTRPIRRRGRRAGEVESDDEIVRETLSDVTDSDDDASSLGDSASETEPESEVESDSHRRGDAHIDTPNTTQSPPPGDVGMLATVNGFHDTVKDKLPEAPATAFLSSGVDWSDIQGEDLPVVEFEHLQEEGLALLAEAPQGVVGAGPSMSGHEEDGQGQGEDKAQQIVPTRRGAHSPNRPRGRAAAQMARQAYQTRLQTDPSFVPVVGEFWGHDDRLLQKDLRSLSGWWRGRWQGRGRGRGGFGMGRGMSFPGRGRGGYVGGQLHEPAAPDASPEHVPIEDTVPAVDRQWTHDGFEEMKAREERRRAFEQEKRLQKQQGGNRGGFAPGRGRGFSRRGAFSPAPSNGSARARAAAASGDKIWYAKKPECPWTKQHEGFLHFDPSSKAKIGKTPAYRVKLPGGKGGEVVRTPVTDETVPPASSQTHAPPESVTDRASNIVVRLPKAQEKVKVEETIAQIETQIVQEPFTTVEELIAEPPIATLVAPAAEAFLPESQSVAGPSSQPIEVPDIPPVTPPSPTINASSSSPITQNSSQEVFISPSQISPSNVQSFEPAERAHLSQLPPIQTHFPPPTQPSPTFNSPYAFNAPQLPPGVALDSHGFAFEVASGRPVYLHPTPPPMQMYNPRPMPHHGMPYHSGHMHHPSAVSSDYMMAPHTPPINGFVDPATGVPLFSLPRQRSRIEIRAPTDVPDGKNREKKPSNLSKSTTSEDSSDAQQVQEERGPVTMKPTAPEYFPSASNPYIVAPEGRPISTGVEAQVPSQQVMDPSMMGYAPYPYYYPEQHYMYPPYAEFPPPGQYEPYRVDPTHPPVYY